MYTQKVTVRCASGLANRQVTYFIQRANEFRSSIWVESGERKINAKSMLGVISLGVPCGAEISLLAEGPDAEAAVKALAEMLQKDVL